MKKKRILNTIIKYVVLLIILLFLLFPLYWVLLTSFKTNMEAYKFPPTFTVKNPTVQSYINLFTVDNDFFTYYKNNFVVAGSAALITTLMAIMAECLDRGSIYFCPDVPCSQPIDFFI